MRCGGNENQAGDAGVVWQAYLKTRKVAAKQVYSQMVTASLTELSEELKIVASIQHVNILSFLGVCHYYDMRSEMSSVVLVTEWCPSTLRNWIKQNANGGCARSLSVGLCLSVWRLSPSGDSLSVETLSRWRLSLPLFA